MSSNLNQLSFSVVDIEASSPNPLQGEICEIGIFKTPEKTSWDSLIKPSEPMSDDIIAIHGITNEMVEGAPKIEQKIGEIHALLQDSIFVAHHAPFDVGFIAWEFEKAGLELPKQPILCTSLLSIRLFPEIGNHKLQTLVQHFGLEARRKHRALDDCLSCAEVLRLCFEKLPEATLEKAIEVQGKTLEWSQFSLLELKSHEIFAEVFRAIEEKVPLKMVYGGGQGTGRERTVDPIGLIRNPDGDYMVAHCHKDQRRKRFYLKKIKSLA